MTQKNNADDSSNSVKTRSKHRKKKKKKLGFIKIAILVILAIIILGSLVVGSVVAVTIKDTPVIDASTIDNQLNQNSFILDQQGKVIEKVLAEENRTSESLDNMPDYLGKAFISIEDERFYDHFGVDIKGILAALIEDIKAGASVRGASTITQQLAKNVYLTNEKSIKRKIKEAYIAIELEKQLNKDQILEAYLNKIYLGQGAYGVKEAALTYFSKDDLNDLTIAESALIAGVTKNPSRLSPYNTVKPENIPEDAIVVGDVELAGEKYTAIFNPESVERQKTILAKMKELGHITEAEYNQALEEDMSETIVPTQRGSSDISSYFIDYVKEQVIDDLMATKKITSEEAHTELLTGGLKIYSTIDVGLQKDIEDMYTNFSKLVFGGGRGSSWRTDGSGNITSQTKKIVYYKKSNVLNDNGDLFIESGNYVISDGGLKINSPKLDAFNSNVDIKDYYTLDNGHLIAHNIGSLKLTPGDFKVVEGEGFVINADYLNKNKELYTVDAGDNLIINSEFFLDDELGVVQPQSATVVMDHSNGQLKALVGGRNLKGSKILNRAMTARQPGSAIKPIIPYLAALDTGYNAATGVEDSPNQNIGGKAWPKNSYSGYKGIMTVREAIKISSNAASVNTLEDIGYKTAKQYLEKLGIIEKDGKDSFITVDEDKKTNDEIPSLALGGMTKGISPLKMTGAYATIASGGTYSKPIAYTKVEDRNGNVILENKPEKTIVVSPGVAYVMTDMLRGVVTSGTGKAASVSGVSIAGKTGTTSDNTDAWFVGYSPQYTASVWIGNDSPSVKLPNGSTLAASFWSKIMTRVQRDTPKEGFKEPDDIVRRQVCTVSGQIPIAQCRGYVKTEIFGKGHEPTGTCDIHSGRKKLPKGSNIPKAPVKKKPISKPKPIPKPIPKPEPAPVPEPTPEPTPPPKEEDTGTEVEQPKEEIVVPEPTPEPQPEPTPQPQPEQKPEPQQPPKPVPQPNPEQSKPENNGQ